MLQPKKRILIIAADAGASRLFECSRLGGPLRQVGERSMQATAPAARDRQFRVHDRFGPGRHAVEPRRSPRVAAEDRFLTDLAAAVGDEVFDELVLCAPPKALGILRQHLPAAARERIILEVAKDYLQETPADLTKRLQALALEAKEDANDN